MSKRITAIVGAGAVLDFDFSGIYYPSSSEITERIKNITVDGYDDERSSVVTHIYTKAQKLFDSIYRRQGIKYSPRTINFEELYFLLESILSFKKASDGDIITAESMPPLRSILELQEDVKSYYSIEYIRALHAIVKEIIHEIDAYDRRFQSEHNYAEWYKSFWKDNPKIKWDVFTFNYDTTIEHSVDNFEDGYRLVSGESYQSFRPQMLLRNPKKWTTVNHLHGCIYYAECAPLACRSTHSNRDMFKMSSVVEAEHYIGLQSKAQSQAREDFLNSPILIGLRKLDKMTYLPCSIYHANLVNKLQANRGLLIVGYSFGDLYVNQLLQRRVLMFGENHRMVIIDSFPKYVNSAVSFRRYILDSKSAMSVFLQPYFDLTGGIDPCSHYEPDFEFTAYDEPIISACKRVMIFICGFKTAVEKFQNRIYRFL